MSNIFEIIRIFITNTNILQFLSVNSVFIFSMTFLRILYYIALIVLIITFVYCIIYKTSYLKENSDFIINNTGSLSAIIFFHFIILRDFRDGIRHNSIQRNDIIYGLLLNLIVCITMIIKFHYKLNTNNIIDCIISAIISETIIIIIECDKSGRQIKERQHKK